MPIPRRRRVLSITSPDRILIEGRTPDEDGEYRELVVGPDNVVRAVPRSKEAHLAPLDQAEPEAMTLAQMERLSGADQQD